MVFAILVFASLILTYMASQSAFSVLVLVMRLAMVPHNLQPPNHCAHSKKAEKFCTNHADRDQLLSADIPNTAKHTLRRCPVGGRTGTGHDG